MNKRPVPPEPFGVVVRPGNWEATLASGVTVRYQSRAVWSAEELESLVAAGWFRSLEELAAPPPAVMAAVSLPPLEPEPPPVPADDAPVTRAELEAKAQELNLKVDRRWSDKRLADTIERALSGQE